MGTKLSHYGTLKKKKILVFTHVTLTMTTVAIRHLCVSQMRFRDGSLYCGRLQEEKREKQRRFSKIPMIVTSRRRMGRIDAGEKTSMDFGGDSWRYCQEGHP